MKDFFGHDRVLNVATFSKISSKTAIDKACRGLNISDDIAGYLKSLVPVNRGKVMNLKECIYGNKKKGIEPVYTLVNEMAKYPNLIESCLKLEGLKTNRGQHSAGIIVCNEPYTNYIASIKSADGTDTTCYNLWDAEEASCIKFDMLSIVAADKIHKTMDYLLKYGKIEWQGSLKATYNKYIHPDVLEYNDPNMWEILPSIYSVFQFDTPISSKALSATKPKSVMDLSAANSLLRLMPDGADETPIDRYIRYKNNHQEWIDDTVAFGLNDTERECLWEYLADAYGLADSQEKIMRLSMDVRVSGYTLKEANKLRKSIAKKDEKLQAEAKAQFFEYGHKLGTREVFLNYIWNVVFAASMGYSFSQLHSYSYSIIALQELNLNWFYPRVYWNCACLSVEASGINEDVESNTSTDYGEVAKAIYKMKQSSIEVAPPSISDSEFDFTPREKDNTILFGLSGITKINNEIANQIISNRPYTSFKDFYLKNSYKGSLVTNSKFVQLIKAGCFDEFEPNRIKVMKQYVVLSTPIKDKLTLTNVSEAIKNGVEIPKELTKPYNFKEYVCSNQFFYKQHPQFKSKKIYWLDKKALKYFETNCKSQLQEDVDWFEENNLTLVVDKSIEKLYKPTMDSLKDYINTPDFIKKYNKCLYRAKYDSLIDVEDVNKWAFSATSYYHYGKHELDNLDLERYNISHFSELPEEPEFIEEVRGKRSWKKYSISAICGTCLAKNDSNHLITILTPNNEVVNIRLNNETYAFYKQQISEQVNKGKKVEKVVKDKSWFERGSLLIITGYRRGDDFVVKKYKSSIFRHKIQKIDKVNEDGSAIIRSTRYGYGDEDE